MNLEKPITVKESEIEIMNVEKDDFIYFIYF